MRICRLASILGMVTALGTCGAVAAPFSWTGAISGDWNTPGNWTNNAVPGTNGTDDVWLMAAGNPPANQNIPNLYVNVLGFNTNAAGYTVGGSTIILKSITALTGPTQQTNTLNVPVVLAANNGWTVNSSPSMAHVVLNGPVGEIGGSRYISANGNGTFILTASNTFSGGLHNNQAIGKFYDDANLGAVPTNLMPNFFEGQYGTWRVGNTNAAVWRRVTIHPNRGFHPTGQSLSLESNLKVVCGGQIYGGGFAKPSDNGGVVVISGNNTNFTGSWTCRSGILVGNHTNAFGPGSATAIFEMWGTVDLNGCNPGTRNYLFVNGQGDDSQGQLRNNDTNRAVTISGNVNLGGGNGGYALQFGGNGDMVISGVVSNMVNGGGSSPYALRKTGPGTLTLMGANTYSNNTSISGGGLTLDYTVQNNRKVGISDPLHLSHAVLRLVGNDAAPTVQTIGLLGVGTDVGSAGGAASIILQPGLNQSLTLAAQAVTVQGGYTLDVTTLTNGASTATLTTTNANGLVAGGGATWNKSTWAIVSGGAITGLGDGSYLTSFATGSTNTHVDVPAGANTLTASVTEQTLRFNSALQTTVMLTNGITLVLSGLNGEPAPLRPGILVTPSAGAVTIDSYGTGQIDPGLNQPLFIHQYSTNAMTFSGRYGGAGAGNSIVKCGPGELIITAQNNTHNNNNYVFGGTLTVDNIKDSSVNCALGSGQYIYLASSTFKYTGPAQTHNRRVYVRGPASVDASGSGLIAFTNTSCVVLQSGGGELPLVLTGSGAGAMLGQIDLHMGSVIKEGPGTWTIGGTQPYTGNTTVNAGTLGFTNSCVLARSLIVNANGSIAGSVRVQEDLVMNGTRRLEIRGDADYDTLAVGYDATLGGALEIVRAEGYRMPANLNMTIVTAGGAVSGEFASVTGGYTLTPSADGKQLLLSRRLPGFIFSLY